jgi:hypothetical protein
MANTTYFTSTTEMRCFALYNNNSAIVLGSIEITEAYGVFCSYLSLRCRGRSKAERSS